MGLFEVNKPAPEDGIEFLDDGLQATTTRTASLFSDLIPSANARTNHLGQMYGHSEDNQLHTAQNAKSTAFREAAR